MKIHTLVMTIRDVDLKVEYDYLPAIPAVEYFDNGDPGHPGTSEDVGIYSVKLQGIEIVQLIKSEIFEEIEKECVIFNNDKNG